jgi:hypothetical protein
VSEFEHPERFEREPTVGDIRELSGASTPHFALQIRNRIATLINGLPEDHAARLAGEREIARLDTIAQGAERRGPALEGEPGMPSLRDAVPAEPGSERA